MSNGNCGQQESSCNPPTGVYKMGGRKQPNVQRPSDGSILGEGLEGDKERGGGSSQAAVEQHMWISCRPAVEGAVRAQQENKRR